MMTVTAPPARGGGRARAGPLKLIAVVAVIVLLLVAIPAGIEWAVGPAPAVPDDGGDGSDFDSSEIYYGPDVTIGGSVTWKDLDETLDAGVYIPSGSALRIERCDLTVLFEDLVMHEGAWFDVMEGGTLELVDSTLTLLVTPQLERAVMSIAREGYDNYDSMGRLNGRFAYVSRPLDLEHATSPVLSFDVSWRGTPTDLVVAREAAPGSPMTAFATLEAPEPVHGEWLHYEVDLSALVGGTPRVSIAPVGGEHRALLVSDLRVLDGGATPRGDSFPTGIASEDGWETYRFEPAIRPWYGSSELPPLITSLGDLRLERTVVRAPDDIPRWSSVSVPDPPSDIMVDRERAMLERSQGADIRVEGIDLVVTDSTIEHVPIGAEASTVGISGSTFVGCTDMLTMMTCQGDVGGCRFVTVPRTGGEPQPSTVRERRSFDWAVACQDRLGEMPMAFKDDAFSGSDVALDLGHARASVTGCTFGSVTGICIWAHDVVGMGGWSDVDRLNTFRQCTGDMYLESHDCVLTFTRPGYPREAGGYGNGYLEDESARSLPPMRYVFADSDGGVLYLPTELVDGEGTVHGIDSVVVWLNSEWAGSKAFAVPTQIETFIADFTPVEEGPSDEDFYFMIEPPLSSMVTHGPGPGDAVISILAVPYIVLTFHNLSALRLQLRIDGPLVEEWDLLDLEGGWPESGLFTYNISLPAGRTLINTSLEGDVAGTPDTIHIYDDAYSVLRVTGSTPQAEVTGFIGTGGHVLLLDPGVEARVDGPPPVPAFDWDRFELGESRTLHADLCEGSRLTVTGGGVGQDEPVMLGLYGNGTVETSGFDCGVLRVSTYGPLCEMADIGCRELYLSGISWLANGTKSFMGTRVHAREGFQISSMAEAECDLTLEDSDIVLDSDSRLVCPRGSATYIGTSIRALAPLSLDLLQGSLSETPPRRVSFQGCRMENVTLVIDQRPFGDTVPPVIAIEGCTLAGGTGYLVLVDQPDPADGHPWPTWLTVADDAFEGAGAGLVAAPGMVAPAMSTCTFTGGATAWAAYPFSIPLAAGIYQAVLALPPFSWRPQRLLQLDRLHQFIDSHILRDVTGDPEAVASPGSVDLIIGWSHFEPVVGFATVEALSGVLDVALRQWDEGGSALVDLIYDILDESGFWTG